MSPVVTSPPKEPCLRCKQSHDTPAAFLMACSKCERVWHHKCHIPPVSEQEIINRITADEQGKRHAGLAAWQCKRCTKRQRTDVQPTVNAGAPPTMPVERTASVSQDAGRPSDSLANSRPQSGAPTSADSKTSSSIVIDLDDEIEIVGSHPVSVVANASQISRPSNRLQTSGVPTPPNAVARSLQSHDLAFKDISTPLDKSTREPQKRPHSDTLPAAPEPLPQKPSMHGLPEPLRAHRPGHRQTGRTGCLPPADKRLEPLPVPQPAQPSQPSAYNTSDLRHLISNLRAKGKLEPPPTIDYVLDRPSSSRQPSARAVHSGRNLVDMRSEMRDLEAVERKLEDSGDEEAMDVDLQEPLAQARESREASNPDPHNIDDLYGEIAPLYRGQPPPARLPRVQSAPTPYNHLLFAVQARRLPEDDPTAGGRGPLASTDTRRPRKGLARQLQGKALQDKQVAGIHFTVGRRHRLDADQPR